MILSPEQEKLLEFVAACDFKGLARAFTEGNLNWHEEEWKHFIEAIRLAERKRIEGIVLPRIQKFIDKVENGKARSIETYKDMKDIRDLLSALTKEDTVA